MTGQEILEALSFVDERYIAEAETAKLGRNIPWMKWLSVAACLCVLITGVYAYRLLQTKGATESMSEAEAAAPPAAIPEAVPEEAPAMEEAAPEAAPEAASRDEEVEAEEEPISPDPAEEKTPAGELHQISYARLRVTYIRDDGSFDAIVEETDANTSLFEKEMQVTVVVDPSKVPGADAEVQNDLRILHTDAQIEIEDGAYDAGLNVLYVTEVVFLCRGDR